MPNYSSHSILAQYMAPKFDIETKNFLSLLKLWKHRYRSRRQLAGLPTYRLNDIGISSEEAEQEAAKPFWKA